MKIHLACGLLAVLATPAAAQSDRVAPSGPRVEVRVGWDRTVLSTYASDDTVTYKDHAGRSGVTYGAEVGYDVPLGPFAIVGAYAGIDGSSTKSCLTDERLGGVSRDCVKAGRNLTAGARVGYLFGPTGLLYGKVGYSNGRVEERYTDSQFPEDNYRDGTNRDGFHLGGGVEIGRAKGVYGKVEYVYTNYNGYEFVDRTTTAKLDLDRHQVVAGMGYRF